MSENGATPLNVLEVALEMAFTGQVLDDIANRLNPTAARQAAMATSVGGIGPLLRERVIAQAALGAKVVGVSLLYDSVWAQGWHSWNHLFIQRKFVGDAIRNVLEQTGITLNLEIFDGTKESVKVWKAAYGGATVYFLDCPSITDVVYPCQEDAPRLTPNPNEWADVQRLKQSWLIGRGALALAKQLNFRPDVTVLSETPTLFANHKLVMDVFHQDSFFERTRYVFNDHTPLEYAHPVWPKSTLDRVKMDPQLYKSFLMPHDKAEPTVDVTRLLVATADGVFGVAKKHGDVMRAMPSLKDYAPKINAITNGVLEDIWQHPDFKNAQSLSDQDLTAAKDKLKEPFLQWIWRRASLWPVWLKTARGKALVLWTRRITSYKRLDLLHILFKNPDMRQRFLNTEIILMVGGRVYQRDNVSEAMVYNLVELLNHDDELGDRVVFLDNFNVWEAPRLFHAADGAIMLANDGREASATGFMKAQMNGGLVVANADGAVPEFVHFRSQTDKPANGFGVAYAQDEPDPESLLKALEDFHAVYKNQAERAAMMRAALGATPQVSVNRTSREMLDFFHRLGDPQTAKR